MVNVFGNLAGTLRLGLGMPKYPLWTLMAALTYLGRQTLNDPAHETQWAVAYVASVAALLSVGYKKMMSPPRRPPPEEDEAPAKIKAS